MIWLISCLFLRVISSSLIISFFSSSIFSTWGDTNSKTGYLLLFSLSIFKAKGPKKSFWFTTYCHYWSYKKKIDKHFWPILEVNFLKIISSKGPVSVISNNHFYQKSAPYSFETKGLIIPYLLQLWLEMVHVCQKDGCLSLKMVPEYIKNNPPKLGCLKPPLKGETSKTW